MPNALPGAAEKSRNDGRAIRTVSGRKVFGENPATMHKGNAYPPRCILHEVLQARGGKKIAHHPMQPRLTATNCD
jgi:hypothetical protein